MKKLKQNTYSLAILLFGMAIVIFMMANSKKPEHQKVLNGLETLNAILKDDLENIPEAELEKLKQECQNNQIQLNKKQLKFCERVGTQYE